MKAPLFDERSILNTYSAYHPHDLRKLGVGERGVKSHVFNPEFGPCNLVDLLKAVLLTNTPLFNGEGQLFEKIDGVVESGALNCTEAYNCLGPVDKTSILYR